MAAQDIQPTPIEEWILQIIKEKNPETIKQLAEMMHQQFALPKKEVLECVVKLEREGKIRLKDTSRRTVPREVQHFLRTRHAYWYWTLVLCALITTTLVFAVPEDAYPLVYARYVLGAIFVLGLPGYTLIKALFPAKELDTIERLTLSLGTSLALVPIAGLLLNYTPWGIRLTPVTLSLLALTLTLATAAVFREHHVKTRTAQATQ